VSVHELSDAEALRSTRSDPEAVCVLYDRYVASLLAALVRRTGDRELAFEIVQETYARTLERGHRVRLAADGSAWPWLWTVARNLLADHRRRGVVDASARDRLGMATLRFHEDGLDQLVDRVDADRLAGPLRRAVDGLPREQREALAGRVAHGLSYRELAGVTGTSEQVLRARVARGLRTLRIRLSGGRP
jgi:RNA polymerase sigma factor (sigma-70 family)